MSPDFKFSLFGLKSDDENYSATEDNTVGVLKLHQV